MQILADLRRYARSAWRHRWRALALAWAVCLIGWAVVYALPDRYRSSARIYADADAVLGQVLRDIAIDSSPAAQVERLQRTLLSRPNLERVVARTGLDMRVDSPAAREALLLSLSKDIRVGAEGRSLFTVGYTDTSATLARDVVQAVINLFMEAASVNDRQQMENARAFVARQLAVYEAQLREAEQRRADFRARYLELLPEGPAGVTRLEQARERLQRLRGELQDMRHRRELTRQQLEATPAALPPELGGPGGESRLAEAERRLRDLRLRYTEQHPEVAAARGEVADLRSGGRAAAAATGSRPGPPRANPLHEQLKLRLVDADAGTNSLERQIREEEETLARLEQMARSAPQVQAQFMNLDRDYNVLRQNYEELLARRESVQIAGAARDGTDRVRLEVVDPPTVPTRPVGPNRLLFASGVLVIGLGAGAALALLLTQLDSSFYSLQNLRKLGLPVLGAISSAQPAPRPGLAVAAFACGLALLLATYGAVLVQGPTLAAKLPQLVARIAA